MPSTKQVGLVIATLLVSACFNTRQVEVVSSGEVVATSATAATAATLPKGADVFVRLDQIIRLDKTSAGEAFTATVRRPVMALNGDVVVPEGARIFGKTHGTTTPDGGHTRIRIEIEALEFNDKRFPMQANVLSVGDVKNKNAFLAGTKMTLRVTEGVVLR
jgi:hypothetical protein